MRFRLLLLAFLLGVAALVAGARDPRVTDYPVAPVPAEQVGVTDAFWTPRMEANRTVSIQHERRADSASLDATPHRLVAIPYFAWANRGMGEMQVWLPRTADESNLYFADDKRFCKLPVSWRLMYRAGGEWKPVAAREPYGVVGDAFNRVTFPAVTTTAVRTEVEPVTRHYTSGEIGPPDAMFLAGDIDWREFGIIEWRVKRSTSRRLAGGSSWFAG